MQIFLLLLNSILGLALVEELTVANDPRHAFHIESFGYLQGGVLDLKVDEFALMVPHNFIAPKDETYEVAFVFVKSASDAEATFDKTRCLHTDYEMHESTDNEIFSLKQRTEWNHIQFQHTVKEPGYYHLYFSNCVESTHTNFKLKTMQYNVDGKGNRVYLPTGLAVLPTWYFLVLLGAVGLMSVWSYMLYKNIDFVRSIHWLMAAVLFFKIITLFCEVFMQHSLKTNGMHNSWFAVFYIFNFIKGMLMFSGIVLLGTGWSYLKPFLTERDKQIILVVIVVQALLNIAMIGVGESTPGSYIGVKWLDILNGLDLLCCFAVLIPIFWSIRQLRAASGSDSKAARNMERLENFRTFYIAVVTWLYFTRIFVYVLDHALPYNMTYIAPISGEFASLSFYALTGWLFRPQKTSPYLALGKDDDDMTAAELEEVTGKE